MPNLRTSTLARILLLNAIPFLAAFAPRPAAQDEAPLLQRRDFADPFVFRDESQYYAFATGVGERHLQIARSSDLHSWAVLGDALPRLPGWAASAPGYTWAPSILKRASGYVLYYSAREASSGFQCISRATSSAPQGPYQDDSARPFVCQSSGETAMCGSIDPSPFVGSDGAAYLLWKSDENGSPCNAPSHLWSQRLSEDGLAVVGAPSALLVADQAWEARLIEGPSMWLHDGRYYLFYSANWYESARYAIGYATCAGPAGPCTKKTTEGPLVYSGADALGPGGEEFFTDSSGTTWMAYHAWNAPKASYAGGSARSLRLAPVHFDSGPLIGPPLL
jgi:beta-xylosidase